MRMVRGVVLSLMALVLLAGCATPTGVGGYFKDRGRDFADSFRLSAGAGLGVHARARVLIFSLGEGFAYAHKAGWDGPAGVASPAWNKLAASATVPFIFDYNVDVRNLEKDAPWKPFLEMRFGQSPETPEAEVIDLEGALVVYGYRHKRIARPIAQGTRIADDYGWVEADVTALSPSLRVGFNLFEFLDFFTGIFAVDLLGDDRHVEGRPSPKQ